MREKDGLTSEATRRISSTPRERVTAALVYTRTPTKRVAKATQARVTPASQAILGGSGDGGDGGAEEKRRGGGGREKTTTPAPSRAKGGERAGRFGLLSLETL